MADDQDPFAKYAKPSTATASDPFAKYRSQPATGSSSTDTDPDDPVGDIGRTLTQGAILDPVEKVGQMAEHLPDWAGGALARRAGAALPDWLQSYLARNQRAAAQHPYVRAAANILPWLLVPGGQGLAVDAALGAGAGLLQPTDPNSKTYWGDVATQTGLGGLLGGSLGKLARRIAGSDAANRTYQALQSRENRLHAEIPEQTTMNVYKRIANEAGDSSLVPSEITPNTAGQVRQNVGKRLSATYQQLTLNPSEPGFATGMAGVRDTVRGALVDPAMRQDWDQAFVDEAGKPIFMADEANPAAPITGDKLNQLMSHLSDVQNEFGKKAQQGAGRQYQLMANGMQRIRNSIERQFQVQNPAVAAERRRLNRAYQLSDLMLKSTSAAKGGVATPQRIAQGIEKKYGKANYADPKFRGVKNMLEEQRQKAAAGPVQLQPPGKAPSDAGKAVSHLASHAAAHTLGVPWWLRSGLNMVAQGAKRGVASVPPAAGGAVGGQVGPSVSFDILGITPSEGTNGESR